MGATKLGLDTHDLCPECIGLGEASDGPPAAYQLAPAQTRRASASLYEATVEIWGPLSVASCWRR